MLVLVDHVERHLILTCVGSARRDRASQSSFCRGWREQKGCARLTGMGVRWGLYLCNTPPAPGIIEWCSPRIGRIAAVLTSFSFMRGNHAHGDHIDPGCVVAFSQEDMLGHSMVGCPLIQSLSLYRLRHDGSHAQAINGPVAGRGPETRLLYQGRPSRCFPVCHA